ncbi:MAG: aminodeoxychorismate synthase component I [Gammaproteobacteria bacterium]|nr:aminodeoxychorismate synthase component I [Gammaproteobacteria bacterium]
MPYVSTPYPLFKKIRHLPLPVLLASGNDRRRNDSRFEFISAAPDKILRANGDTTVIEFLDGTTRVSHGNPLDILAAEFPLTPNSKPEEAFPFTGGAIGFFGYELLHLWHRIAANQQRDIDLPDMLVGFYSWVLVIDHQEQCCNLIIQDDCPDTTRRAVKEAFTQSRGQTSGKFNLTGKFISNFSRDEYQKAYQQVIDYIHAGDCYQVNLTQRFSAPCSGDPCTAFTRLQTIAKAPFAAFMEDGEQAVLSFSPERFIQVKDCQVMTQPIKGTRPRDSDPIIDLHNRTELETSLKDRAENLMIVDLMRNDLGRICSTSSIAVPDLFETQSFTNVHHLVSTITGSLKNAQDVFALLKAGFPGGSITGTPKIRAMEIINELETVMRSVYCGAFAWIDLTGNMDSNICIRTLVKDKGSIHCWGGGGVVADSIGEQEYQETLDKISLFMDALKADF